MERGKIKGRPHRSGKGTDEDMGSSVARGRSMLVMGAVKTVKVCYQGSGHLKQDRLSKLQ